MAMDAYSLNSPVQQLMQGQTLARVSPVMAIRQHIHLLLSTRPGEYRFDPAMGNGIWAFDFDTHLDLSHWNDQTEELVSKLIRTYEPRLSDVRVQVETEEVPEVGADGRVLQLRRRITITVRGTLAALNEPLSPQSFVLFISPVATV